MKEQYTPKDNKHKKPEKNRKNLRIQRMLARGIRPDGTNPSIGPAQSERDPNTIYTTKRLDYAS